MNILGYLVTISNLQNMPALGGPSIKDLSVKVDTVQSLASAIANDLAFPPQAFRPTGFYKVGNTGKYISENLRAYLYGTEIVDPNEKGLVLTVTFKNPDSVDGNEVVTLNHADPIPVDTDNGVNYSGFFTNKKKRDVGLLVPSIVG